MSLEHWVWLSELQIDKLSLYRLLEHFSEPQRIYEATAHELAPAALSRSAQETLLSRRDLKAARAIIARCEREGFRIVTMQDAAYPDRLRNISLPPLLLYAAGQMPSFDEEAAIGVVGTRSCSEMSENIAYTFGYELSEKGMLVISGMAMGIDAAANAGALASGARTVAVLGCGLDRCYPASSQSIYDSLRGGRGCLISEYPPGTPPLPGNFPARNRIISGLSAGILVIAAPERSGSLITAGRALEQGREIFVIPGGILEQEFAGSNALIKSGAIPVTTPKDIIAYYYGRFPDAFDPERISEYMQSDADTAERMQTIRRSDTPYTNGRPVYGRTAPGTEHRSRTQQLRSLFSGERREEERGKRRKTASRRTEKRKIELPAALSEDHRRVFELLQNSAEGTAHSDELVNQSGLPASDVLSILTDLELEGVVTALPGKRFQICK